MRTSLLAKIWFFLSVAVLGVAYGILASERGWFPSSLAKNAWKQGHVVLPISDLPFLNERVYERRGVRISRKGEMQPGLTSITSSWKTSDGWKVGLKLIGKRGTVYREWLLGRSELFGSGLGYRKNPKQTDLQGTYLFSNGDVLVNLEYVGMARINACGRVLWTLAEGTHHSVARASDGTFWTPGVSQRTRRGSERFREGFPGLGEELWVDRILQVRPDGTLLRDINVLDVLYANGLEYLFFKHRVLNGDVTHMNDIEPLRESMAKEYPLFERGDLLVSLRYLNLVFVMDPETENVRWYATGPFIAQHDPDFIGDGWIGIFDNNRDYNGGTVLGGSRIVAVRPQDGRTEVRFPKEQSDPFYTRLRGKWQQLENGNLLLTESQSGRVVEVNPDGETVWEWVHQPYDDSRVPAVTKAQRYPLSSSNVASWPCTSVDSVRTSKRR